MNNQFPKPEPDKPGRWLFTGRIWFMGVGNEPDEYYSADKKPYDVVEVDGRLYVEDIDTGEGYVIPMFTGWWIPAQEGSDGTSN